MNEPTPHINGEQETREEVDPQPKVPSEQAIAELYGPFNQETKDGRDMSKFSKMLGDTIASIIEVKNESDIDSFLSGGSISFAKNQIKGLDDFELICFLVVR